LLAALALTTREVDGPGKLGCSTLEVRMEHGSEETVPHDEIRLRERAAGLDGPSIFCCANVVTRA
jgi:hypothetical protein